MKTLQKILFPLICLTAVNTWAFETPNPGETTAHCNWERYECYLNWDLSNSSKHYFLIQRYVRRAKKWQTEPKGTTSEAIGTSNRPMKEGHLYRVIGCDTEKQDADCVSSMLVWAPIASKKPKDIPEMVQDSRGVEQFVSKEESYVHQLLQYNVYMFSQRFQAAELDKLPPMTPRTPDDLPLRTLEDPRVRTADLIHINIYSNYQGLRNEALGIETEIGPEEPDARLGGPLL